MAIVAELSLDDAKRLYPDAFIKHRFTDVAVLALDGNADAVQLLVYRLSSDFNKPGGELGLVDYWRALRRVEDALLAENLPI